MANVDAAQAGAQIPILRTWPPVVQVVPDLPAVPASVALRALAWLIDLLLVAAVVVVTRMPFTYGLPLACSSCTTRRRCG